VSTGGGIGRRSKSRPAPGVRGVELSPDDPVSGEWVVAVIGTHYLGALIAKDLGDDDSTTERGTLSFIVTHACTRRIGPQLGAFLGESLHSTVRIQAVQYVLRGTLASESQNSNLKWLLRYLELLGRYRETVG